MTGQNDNGADVIPIRRARMASLPHLVGADATMDEIEAEASELGLTPNEYVVYLALAAFQKREKQREESIGFIIDEAMEGAEGDREDALILLERARDRLLSAPDPVKGDAA